jgi:ABC-type transporter Mla subunit MlaD
MTTNADYHQIEADIADISRTIANQQQYVYDLTTQRINTAYQYDAYVKGQRHNLRRFIKQKNELENKLQRIHEERYNEFNKTAALSGISDVLSLAFQYAHPIDKTTNKYAVEKRIIKSFSK